jgi:hypothetical protein
MNEKVYSLKDINGEQNFALATLCKQKECLNQWLKYLNVKNIYMPEEVEKYRKRISQINDAIKILEDELNPQSEFSEKNLLRSSTKHTKPAKRKTTPSQSKSNSFIANVNVADAKNHKLAKAGNKAFPDN